MAINIYSDILNKIKNMPGEITNSVKKARDWLRKTVTSKIVGDVSPRAIPGSRMSSKSMPTQMYGDMIMFNYDAKLKEKLPYFDQFPIVFPFSDAKKGFLGLNLHYLPPYLRARVMDELYKIMKLKTDDATKMKLSYTLLQSSARFNLMKPCIKHYLFAHIKSKFIKVPQEEWSIVLFLPTERFVSVRNNKYTPINKRKVWADSSKKSGVSK